MNKTNDELLARIHEMESDLAEARSGWESASAELADTEAERDKLRSDIELMVKKAADNHLEGYRELGRQAANAENRADQFQRERNNCQELYMKLREQSDLSVARIHRLEKALRIMLMEPWDRTAGQADEARAALEEEPAVSLATVKAGAIEKATEEVQARQEALFGRLGSPSEAQREGIGSTLLDFRMYAAEIRQSASQPEITDEQGRPMTYWGGKSEEGK